MTTRDHTHQSFFTVQFLYDLIDGRKLDSFFPVPVPVSSASLLPTLSNGIIDTLLGKLQALLPGQTSSNKLKSRPTPSSTPTASDPATSVAKPSIVSTADQDFPLNDRIDPEIKYELSDNDTPNSNSETTVQTMTDSTQAPLLTIEHRLSDFILGEPKMSLTFQGTLDCIIV